MPSRIQKCEEPNRHVLVIFGLLAVFAVSIFVAIRFPYVDMNAQALLIADNAIIARDSDDSGVDVAVGVGGEVATEVSIIETSHVGTGDSSASAGGVEVEILLDDVPAETSEIDHDEDQSVGDGDIVSL
jgi:hypothetical protein